METSDAHRRCGVGIRGVAMAIDSVVWIALFMFAVTAIGYVTGDLQTTSEGIEANLHGGPALGALALWFGLSIGYHTLLEWRWGKTLGKYLVSIEVTTDSGSPPSLQASFLRNLFRLVDWLPLFYLVGIVAILTTTEDKRLGDRFGNTVVVRR